MALITLANPAIYNNNVGNPTDGELLRNDLQTVFAEVNAKEVRITNLESASMTISGTKTFSIFPVFPSGEPTTSLQGANKFYVDQKTDRYLHSMGKPKYLTATTFSVAYYSLRASSDLGTISKTTPTTVNLATFGLDGFAQSATQTGTVGTGGAPSTTITGVGTSFTTVFQVGDIFYTASGSARITAIGGLLTMTVATALTIANGTSFKRGGPAANTWYYLYAVSDGTTPGLVLSTRNVSNGTDTLPVTDLPSASYTLVRQARYNIGTNGSSQQYATYVTDGWPNMPVITYDLPTTFFNGGFVNGTANVLAGGTAGVLTDVSLTGWVPPTSQSAKINLTAIGSGIGAQIKPKGATTNCQGFTSSGGNTIDVFNTPTDSAQTIQYIRLTGAGSLNIDVVSYTITEVP